MLLDVDEERSRPRLWPTLIACFGILPAFLAASIAVTVPFLVGHALFVGDDTAPWFAGFSETLPGLFGILIPTEAFLVLVALALAAFSPTPWRERLALCRPRLSALSLVLVMLGSVGVLLAVQVAADALIETPSDQLLWIARVIMRHDGAAAVVLTVLLSVVPGFAEELFFRGYVQTRLAQRWPAWAAIGLAALSFAILHFDPQHSSLVLPMGLWLGFLAWTTGSVWTAMLGHATINAVACVLTNLFGDPETGELPPEFAAPAAVGLCATALCAVHLLLRKRAATPAAAPALE
jgi:membrane protease YdiL (CAAX protease family)